MRDDMDAGPDPVLVWGWIALVVLGAALLIYNVAR